MSFLHKIEAYKKISEDMIEVCNNKEQNIYILCDGAGGFGGGYNAAKACISLLKEKLLSKTITKTSLITDIRTTCFSLLSEGIGQTTLIVVIEKNNKIIGASCGDSDAYLLKNDSIEHITKNQENIRVGDLSIPVIFEYDSFDKIIIGSDGLWRDCSIDFLANEMKKNSDLDVIDIAFKKVSKYELQDDFSILIISK